MRYDALLVTPTSSTTHLSLFLLFSKIQVVSTIIKETWQVIHSIVKQRKKWMEFTDCIKWLMSKFILMCSTITLILIMPSKRKGKKQNKFIDYTNRHISIYLLQINNNQKTKKNGISRSPTIHWNRNKFYLFFIT